MLYTGGKQDGKLWSLERFDRKQMEAMMDNPNVKKINTPADYRNYFKDN